MDELDDIIQEFLVESHENLDQLDHDLVALEQNPNSRDMLSSIFRTIHTIKGTSGFLAFHKLEKLTHAGESLLSRLRDGTQSMTPQSADALLRMVDTVRELLGTIERDGVEGDVDVEPVIEMVADCIEDGPKKAAAKPAAKNSGKNAGEKAAVQPSEPAAAVTETPAAAATVDAVDRPVESDVNDEDSVNGEGAVVAESTVVEPAAVKADENSPSGKRSIAESSIRVDVDLLDALMRLVGELVLTRNQIVRAVGELTDASLSRTTQRLNLITSELQESVMKTRMQPIDHIWAKLPRIVRDLSSSFGKQVRIVMEGKETELDRSLLEAVKDPLTHLVRNAVDHGIETTQERTAAGKDPVGTLRLRAYHEGGHVIVEIIDDGAGIDADRVAATALERGIITKEQLARMEPRELLALLFRPGFSTAKKITNVSGRGVGMDVVKTNIEQIGGSVDVDTTLGKGTTWRLTIPLTLAIIQALTVEGGGERYSIPQVGVDELVFVDGQSGQSIERVQGAAVYRLRGKLLPLIRLDEALGMPADHSERDVYIVVLQVDGRRFGLVVDRVLNTEEIVVKPLSAQLKDVGVYAGSTITGDGRVALILDTASLARRAHLVTETVDRIQPNVSDGKPPADVEQLLITGIGERRVAIPLDMVTRLEEFSADRIERVGNREVVQYRDEILPVVRLAHLLGSYVEDDGPTVSAVVYTEGGRSVALVVQEILDIVEDSIATRSDLDGDGLTGSAVIQDRVTELLDVRSAILAADPRFYAETAQIIAAGV